MLFRSGGRPPGSPAATRPASGWCPRGVVAERLSHSSVAFTLDIYAHVMPDIYARARRTGRGERHSRPFILFVAGVTVVAAPSGPASRERFYREIGVGGEPFHRLLTTHNSSLSHAAEG